MLQAYEVFQRQEVLSHQLLTLSQHHRTHLAARTVSEILHGPPALFTTEGSTCHLNPLILLLFANCKFD